MRFLLTGLLVLLAGCGEGRYQIAVGVTAGGVWRLDTKTGEVAVCAVGYGGGTKIACVSEFK